METKKKDSCAVKLGRKGGQATARKRKAKRKPAAKAKATAKRKPAAKRKYRPATQASLF